VPDLVQTSHTELDPEADGGGLLWVDLLSLPKTFSWRRYRTDLIGLLVAVLIVIFLMLVLVLISRLL
jgi:hypothetical protein